MSANEPPNYSSETLAAAAMLSTPPGNIPAAAKKEYAIAHSAAVEALADEANPAKRTQMASYYNSFLSQYAEFSRRSEARMAKIVHDMPAVGQQQLAMLGKQWNAEFWDHFRAGTNTSGDYGWVKTLPRMELELGLTPGTAGSAPREAFDKLADKMRGPNMILGLVYDEQRARKDDSTLSGIKFGALGGAVAGFFAGDMLGLEGIGKWIARIGGVLAGLFAGGWVEDKIRGDKGAPSPTPPAYPAPHTPGGGAPLARSPEIPAQDRALLNRFSQEQAGPTPPALPPGKPPQPGLQAAPPARG